MFEDDVKPISDFIHLAKPVETQPTTKISPNTVPPKLNVNLPPGQPTPDLNQLPDVISVKDMLSKMTPAQLQKYNNQSNPIQITGPDNSIMHYVRQGMGVVRGIGDTVAGGLGAAGSTALGVGPIPGRILGNTVADQVYQQVLQRSAPKVFGAPPDNALDSLAESGINAGLDTALSDLIPMAWRATKLKVGQSSFKPNPLETESRAALAADPNLPVTVGQATGSKFASAVENLFGGQKLKTLQADQQSYLTKSAENMLRDFSGGQYGLETTTARLAENSLTAATTAASRNRNIQNALYTQLEKGQIPNEKTVVAVPTTKGSGFWNNLNGFNGMFGNAEIQGPVRLLNTVENANTIGTDIDALVKDPTNVFNSDDMKEIGLIKQKVDSFRDSLPYDKNGNPVISYQVAKAIKTGQIDFLQGASEDVRKRLTGTIENLKNSIGSDMNDSIYGNPRKNLPALWSKAGQDAYSAATTKFKDNLARFGPDFAKELAAGTDPNIVQEHVIQNALTSVKQMKQYKATLDPGASEPLILLAQNVLNKAKGVNGVWDGEAGLKQLQDYIDSGVAKEAFPNSSSLQGFKYLLNRMRTVSPSSSDIGKVAVTMNMVRGGMSVGAGALTFALTGNVPVAGVATGGMVFASVPLAKNIISEFMLNPINARKLAGIATSPPNSIMAQQTIRQIIKSGVKSGALKGVLVDVMGENNRPLGKATFNSNGDLVPAGKMENDNSVQ